MGRLPVLFDEAVQRGLSQGGQAGAGGVAPQAGVDDVEGERLIALAEEGFSGPPPPARPGPGQAEPGQR